MCLVSGGHSTAPSAAFVNTGLGRAGWQAGGKEAGPAVDGFSRVLKGIKVGRW